MPTILYILALVKKDQNKSFFSRKKIKCDIQIRLENLIVIYYYRFREIRKRFKKLSSFNKKRGLKKWVHLYAKHVILLLIILKMKK